MFKPQRCSEFPSSAQSICQEPWFLQTRVKVTEAAYQAAIENVQALKASLQDRRASYDLTKKKVADAVIKAQIPGAISDRTVQRGEYIRENTQVVTIVRMNPLKLKTA